MAKAIEGDEQIQPHGVNAMSSSMGRDRGGERRWIPRD